MLIATLVAPLIGAIAISLTSRLGRNAARWLALATTIVTFALAAVVVETPLGWAGVNLSSRGIRHATLFHRTRDAAEGELRAFGGTVGAEDARANEVAELLRAYADGDRDALSRFPIDLPVCTALQRRTWLALREIPAGETRSYGWLARQMGVPGRARAIGAMMGQNPVPLWLPCHRVVGADGSLTGYAGGLERKRFLLELEGAPVVAQARLF